LEVLADTFLVSSAFISQIESKAKTQFEEFVRAKFVEAGPSENALRKSNALIQSSDKVEPLAKSGKIAAPKGKGKEDPKSPKATADQTAKEVTVIPSLCDEI